MMSSRTLGTSAKKNRAKKPATPPNPAAKVPLYYVSASSRAGKVDVQLDEVTSGDAVEVALDGVPGGHVSSSSEHVWSLRPLFSGREPPTTSGSSTSP